MKATLLGVGLLAGALPLNASGRALEGTDYARLVPPRGARVEAYANAGYRLEPAGGEVRVWIDVAPLDSRDAFTPPSRRRRTGELATLAQRLVAGASTRYEASSRLLAWVVRNIRYELDRDQEQSAPAVLARRSAYCTGFARLAVALHTAVGIPAREVPGWVVPDGTVDGGGYHRWIEVLYADRGWVFSDPISSHHYVPASYIRLASAEVELEPGPGLLLERRDQLRAADLYAWAPPSVTARRNHGRQLAATIAVTVAGAPDGVAELEGEGRRRQLELGPGGGTFLGLTPGSYALEVLLRDGRVLRRAIEIGGPVRAALHLTPPDASAALPSPVESP